MAATLSDHAYDARIRAAAKRIDENPELEEYREFLLGEDDADHLDFVATARIDEIVELCKDHQADEGE
jgi:hypothetical protein